MSTHCPTPAETATRTAIPAIGDASRRRRRATVSAGLFAALTSALIGCGGGNANSIGTVAGMPQGASGKAMSKAESCDDGDLDACNWVGVWYMVGGAGKERRGEGVRYVQHACTHGHDRACKLLAGLRRAAEEQP